MYDMCVCEYVYSVVSILRRCRRHPLRLCATHTRCAPFLRCVVLTLVCRHSATFLFDQYPTFLLIPFRVSIFVMTTRRTTRNSQAAAESAALISSPLPSSSPSSSQHTTTINTTSTTNTSMRKQRVIDNRSLGKIRRYLLHQVAKGTPFIQGFQVRSSARERGSPPSFLGWSGDRGPFIKQYVALDKCSW